MKDTVVAPTGIVKHIVGETLMVNVRLNPEFHYQVELYTNCNRITDTYRFDYDNGTYICSIHLKKSGFFSWQVRYRREGSEAWKWIKEAPRKRLTGYVQVDPAWINTAVVYNVFVRFFAGAVASENSIPVPGEGGTFDDVKAYLDVLQTMGINTLYFNPIHPIGELYRKFNHFDKLPSYLQPGSPYSIKDFKSIDPELAYDLDTGKYIMSDPEQEFRDLVEAAHARGMHVIMDLVFNHTAHDFIYQRIRPEWFLYKEHVTSLTDPYLYPEDIKHGKPWGDARHTLAPYDHGCWFEDAAQLNWEFRLPDAPNQPPSNPSLKEMWEFFKSIPKYWITKFGIDGFRCDVAYRVPPLFWKACIAEAREVAQQVKTNLSSDVIFLAESYTDDLQELQEVGFSAVYGDYSNKLRRPLDLDGYLKYMYNISGDYFPKGSKWFIFPEGHDFERTPSKIVGNHNKSSELAYISNVSRWIITATLPGIPLIFNGFEKAEWNPVNLFGYGAVDWSRDVDLKQKIAAINHIRSKHVQFSLTASFNLLNTNQGLDDKTQIIAYHRSHHGKHAIVVVNLDIQHQAGPAIVYLPEKFSGSYTLKDELTGETYQRSGRELTVILKPGQGHIFIAEFS